MASAGARAYMGVWGLCLQLVGSRAKPLVRGALPPEAESFLQIRRLNLMDYWHALYSVFELLNIKI
jgi:hypothetical protein